MKNIIGMGRNYLGKVGVVLVLATAPAYSAGDTICIGMNGPLPGPSAGWALPGLTGLQLIVDGGSANNARSDYLPVYPCQFIHWLYRIFSGFQWKTLAGLRV